MDFVKVSKGIKIHETKWLYFFLMPTCNVSYVTCILQADIPFRGVMGITEERKESNYFLYQVSPFFFRRYIFLRTLVIPKA